MYLWLVQQSNYLESELVLHCHDNLHVIKRVQSEVIDEVTVEGQLVSGDLRNNYKFNSLSPHRGLTLSKALQTLRTLASISAVSRLAVANLLTLKSLQAGCCVGILKAGPVQR